MAESKLIATLAAQLTTRQHTFLSGVPATDGGSDEGPNPHEYVEAALAACTTITIQMYANRKQWNLLSADVRVKITEEGESSRFSREISFRGQLSDEQRARLLEIADKCPVHKLLESKIAIDTRETTPNEA
ncbi:MAG: OsmC family protein [Bdellovibrionota bacterium]